MLSRNTSNSCLGMEDLYNQNSTGLFIKTANRKKKKLHSFYRTLQGKVNTYFLSLTQVATIT